VLNSLLNESKIAGLAEVIPEVESTQKVLLARGPSQLNSGVTLVTHHQTAGIGRLDRTWESAPGDGILMSYVFRSDLQVLSLFVATAVANAVAKYLPNVKLKWPNDLVVEVDGVTRKLGGIVLQRHPEDSQIVVAGIGINLRFSNSRPTAEAIALDELVAQLPDPNQLIFEIIKELGQPALDEISSYESFCLTLGKQVEVQMLNAPTLIGKAIRVSTNGELVVETETGEVEILTGDVKHLRASE
jgi:BirA family biotin operon repressor/biotin-[acetyl-CoA-carboxylase] ligase